MASPGFDIDTQVYRTLADRLEAIRGDLDAATARLRATVDGGRNPWGDDQQGSLFGQLYTQGLGHILDAMTTHQDQLTYAAGSMRAAAQGHDDNDEAVASRFTDLGSGLTA